MNGIGSLIKANLSLLPCEDTQKKVLIGPGRGSSPERDHAGILLLDSQASIELREIISVVYKPPRLWRFIMATLKDQGRQTVHHVFF